MLGRFRDLSIQYKLTLMSLLISGTILLLASAVFVFNDVTTLRDMLVRGLQVKARMLASNSRSAMDFNDPDAAGRTLSSLRVDSHILAARIYTAQGASFVSYRRGSPEIRENWRIVKDELLKLAAVRNEDEELKNLVLRFTDAQDKDYLSEEMRVQLREFIQDPQNALSDSLQIRLKAFLSSYHVHLPKMLSKPFLEFAANTLRYALPIEDDPDNTRLGMLIVVSDLDELHSRLLSYAVIVSLVVSASVLLAYLLAARLQRIITTPILALSRLTQQVSRDKNYTLRAHHNNRDELGMLFHGFNDMLAAIQERDEQLATHREELEKTVELRTAELRNLNTQLTYQAYHDALTNLPNRALFVRQVEQSISYAQANNQHMAMLFIDLDHFKYINDTLGHSAGDRILQEVAKRLLSCTRQPEDSVARLGGDEFTVLLRNIKEYENAGVVARKIIQSLSHPFSYNQHNLHVTPSIGISIYPRDGDDVGILMRNADSSMYQAKLRGRNTYEFYTAATGEQSKSRLHLENKLRNALEYDEFEVWFQPRFDLVSGDVISAEALVRWRSPELNLVSPAEFIPLAEDTGLIIPIGEWVLRGACEECLRWQALRDHPVTVSVNFSARQFAQEDLLGKVASILKEMKIAPELLEMELTESLIMPHADETIMILQRLKELGLTLSVDDFGTGYSSLSYLKRFPIDILKIDQSFIFDMLHQEENGENNTLVTAIIAMAHKLKLGVVAEGVETEEQLAFLQAQHCDYVQGYLFGKPLPADKFRDALQHCRGMKDFLALSESVKLAL